MTTLELEKSQQQQPVAAKKPFMKKLWKFIRKNPAGVAGIILVVLSVSAALFAQWIAPFDPSKANLTSRLVPPSWTDETGESIFFLGADQVGRDLLSRIIHGAKISLMVGFFGVIISMIIGTVLGLISGFFGKWLDDFIMRVADIQLAFPFMLFAIVIMSVLGTGIWKIIIILGLTYWVGFARLIRGEVISLKEQEYVQAAKAIGGTNFTIIRKHILPNVMSSILVLGTMYIAEFILLEASLTFLGLGVDPTIPSWGGMLADSRNYVTSAWWTATFPGIAIMLTVLGFNLLGDWLRDRFDPNMKL
ncbi:peptide ABC transporter permease [Cytobacillus firmus]|uniref:ABC transporter permease n=1 Tax=Cytobacillus firmus TaxID=1399 RepID=UPI00077C2B32|nr:peptide ABC transporter permease [Cytobacillus firmus]MBG9551204.1 peptide ABC transporter permease [Cytobacillus firmus]MBG9557986.1 peptide ABC transporter permease [Cytobacillus firmus]MBG9577609.1 peptide ABC transporter permease [Cytobacillus firmus]SUV10816.1 oligopeptide ABC transporter permease [Cytobacillus firmus]